MSKQLAPTFRPSSTWFGQWGGVVLSLAATSTALMAQGPALPSSRIEPEQTAQTATPTAPKAVRVTGPVRTAAAPAEPQGTPAPTLPVPAAQPTPAPNSPPVVTPAAGNDATAGSPSAVEFASLLTGSELTGWRIHEGKAGSWKRTGDVISTSGNGGGWLMSEQQFSDFVLRFEFRLGPGANSGVAIRCPEEGNPSSSGMEIQLLDDASPKYAGLKPTQYTGSVYYHVAPQTKAKLAPTGQWNRCEVRCVGSHVTVIINETPVNDVALRSTTPAAGPEAESEIVPTSHTTPQWTLAERPPLGHVALQSHPAGVDFRKVEIQNLAQVHPSGLQVVELDAGDASAPVVSEEDHVAIHFVGQLSTGKVFTDSYPTGAAVKVAMNDVIAGWKEGIQGMHPGARRRLIVPPGMAYGSEGVENLIPPDATLVFEVELQRIER